MPQTIEDKSKNISDPEGFHPSPRASKDPGTIGQAACREICKARKKNTIKYYNKSINY
jgi:hypothetical protein